MPLVAVPSVKFALVVVRVEAESPVIASAPLVLVMFKAPDDRVNPLLAVSNPALVIVPLVVMASPLFNGDNVVPVLLQYPSPPVPVGETQLKFPLASFANRDPATAA